MHNLYPAENTQTKKCCNKACTVRLCTSLTLTSVFVYMQLRNHIIYHKHDLLLSTTKAVIVHAAKLSNNKEAVQKNHRGIGEF